MPCRYCLIHITERSNLDFNIIEYGRYSEQSRQNIARVKGMTKIMAKRNALGDLGVHDDWRLMNALGQYLVYLLQGIGRFN